MEPMLLGSPVSPVSGAAGAPGSVPSTAAAPYLPSYLLGDTQYGMSGRVPLSSSSPGGTRHYGSSVTGAQASPASPHASGKEPMPPNFNTPKFGRMGVERASGPPVQCLSSPAPSHNSPALQQRLHSPFPSDQHLLRSARTPLGSPHTPLRPLHSPSLHQGLRDQALNSSIISVEVHSDAAASAALSDEWVTVFGFPVASASFILTQFAQLGTIADQRLPGSGNWMHLRYQTALQARKALALNGKVFSHNIMIGVTACTDRAVVMDKENQRLLAANNNSSFMSPSLNNSTAFDNSFSTPKAHMRSLTQAYHTTPAENQVIPAAHTPKKNDSFMSKAMQQLLGV